MANLRSIKLEFSKGGVTIAPNESVSGAMNAIQKCSANLITRQGSDLFFPERGTELLAEATAGNLQDETQQTHAFNFACIDTIFFVRDNSIDAEEVYELPDSINLLELDRESTTILNVKLEAAFDGQPETIDTTITVE